MTKTVDYHYSLMSPWSYLGGPRLDRIAAAAGATVNFKPINLGKVFPATGGLPLATRGRRRRADFQPSGRSGVWHCRKCLAWQI